MLAELRTKQKEIENLKEEINRLNAYIDGLQWGIRAQRRIIINTTGEEKK
jgi:peptidoglycan hydrolase CwlO-like protein